MKSGMTTEEQVLEVINDQLGAKDMKLDAVVLNATGIDRECQRELVMRLEEELELEIPDKDAEKLNTVKDIVEYITKKKEVK